MKDLLLAREIVKALAKNTTETMTLIGLGMLSVALQKAIESYPKDKHVVRGKCMEFHVCMN